MNRLRILLICFCFILVTGAACVSIFAGEEDEIEGGDGSKAADQPVAASEEGRQAMGRFAKPEGWSVSLFAAEPELANPVALALDAKGRVYVCESFRQDRGVTDNRGHDREWLLADLAAESVQDRIDYHKRLLGTSVAEYTAHDDRIRRLVDTNGDGTCDTMTVFAEGFNNIEDGTGAGLLVRGNEAYYTCIPKLWKLTDKNDDGQADIRTALHDGYGVRVAFRGHDLHGLVIGPDGRLYFSIGDRGYNIESEGRTLKDAESGAVFRCELDGSNLEVFATGLRNPQELAFDDYGFLFTGDNNSDSGDKARWVQVMEGGDTGWRMMYQYLPDRGPFNREHIWEPYNADVTPAYIVPPIANISDGPSGLACYPGTGLTGDYANCFFLVDFRGGAANSGVRLIRTQRKGAFWEVERSEQPLWNILATDFEFGPDGGMWVCDWVEGWVGEGKGRVYRFQDDEAQKQDIVKEVQNLLARGFNETPNDELGAHLTHLDRRIRNESQWELVARGELKTLDEVLRDESKGTIARLHAVWGIGQLARTQAGFREKVGPSIGFALKDPDLDIRAAALTVAGDLDLASFESQVIASISDDEPRVQYAACVAAGKLNLTSAIEPVADMLTQNDNQDPGLRHAGIMALKGAGDLTGLVNHPESSVRLAAVVALRKRADGIVAKMLEDGEPAIVLEAARAIHDVPELHSNLEALAKIDLPAGASDALVHRVLNANFRLGTEYGLARIANLAADARLSDAMRTEALDMLSSWGTPGDLDRVMNRYMPLEQRDAKAASLAMKTIFPSLLNVSDTLLAKVVDTASALKLEGSRQTLEGLASDSAQPNVVRAKALKGVVQMGGNATKEWIQSMLDDKAVEVRIAALSELGRIDLDAAMPRLESAMSAGDYRETQAAYDLLAKSRESSEVRNLVESGVGAYLQGDLPKELWLNVMEAAREVGSETVREQLEGFTKKKAAESLVEAYRECEVGGDVEAGKTLFFEKTELSCVRCHKVGDTGGEVGPDLTKIASSKDSRYLLEAIVHPDAKIAEKFETVILLTEDDEILTGILRSEDDDFIELIDAEGKITKIEADLVIHRKKGKSAMPADLVKQMTRRELRDLVAYLASLKGE